MGNWVSGSVSRLGLCWGKCSISILSSYLCHKCEKISPSSLTWESWGVLGYKPHKIVRPYLKLKLPGVSHSQANAVHTWTLAIY